MTALGAEADSGLECDDGGTDAGIELDGGIDAGLPPIPPPPDWIVRKVPLTWEDYVRKNEGWYVTGLPLVNYDSNTGVGLGVRVYLYENGPRLHPLFAYSPYRHRVFAQAFFTTGGFQFHWLDYDAPYFLGTLFRLRAQLTYGRNTAKNFFGTGSRGMAPLRFAAEDRSFAGYSEYEGRLKAVQPDGTANTLYDKLDAQRPWFLVSLEREFFGGLLRPFIGLAFSYTSIRDYSGATFDAVDASGQPVRAPMADTRLKRECAAGLVVGCNGGWDNWFRIAVAFDTRDFEPDPNSGVLAELSAELGTRILGSQFDYARVLMSVRGFYSPIPWLADLVVGGRVLLQLQTPGAPFFTMNNLPFTEDNKWGLGGFRTLRGYKQDRFVGSVMTLLNLEIRWTFVRFELLKQKFALIAVPFLDLGASFDSIERFTLKTLKRGQGGGLRIAWNQATIIYCDVAFSDEDVGIYINFSHIF